ncbi:hypothetical protein [Inquilinus limosus]|uniref:AsmA-like C-terminal domain-containing protein n=1 Tax=Inquilinus limosus MP06 TaxID=1398085 RepID=A0A0A0DDT8_9PROT|nr:hypothetical protein [Inquilinus limosus]KGM36053.1 hypothetical protein P409_00850 [Inquilinus limosus MP06]
MVRITSVAGAALAALLLGILARPAEAASVPTDPVKRCRGVLDLLAKAPDASETPLSVGTVEPAGKAGCRYGNLRISAGYSSLDVEALSLDRLDFQRVFAGQPPLTLSVKAEGIRMISGGNPVTAYYSKLVVRPFVFTLDYALAPDTGLLTVSDLSLRHEINGSISATGTFSGVSPDLLEPWRRLPDAASLARIALNRFSFRLQNQGLFEAFTVMPMLAALPNGTTDPEGAVAAAKAGALARLRIVGESVLPPDTMTALTDLIQDLPKPRRPLAVTIAPAAPVRLSDIADAAMGDDAAKSAILKRLNPTVTYAPAP